MEVGGVGAVVTQSVSSSRRSAEMALKEDGSGPSFRWRGETLDC